MNRLTQRSVFAMLVLGLAGFAPACATETELEDGENDVVVVDGKADGAMISECELREIVDYVNDGATTFATLRQAGVATTAARNIIAYRDGADTMFGTEDDNLFEDAAEVDAVRYVGPVAFRKLRDAVADRCVTPPGGETDVTFSPQAYEQSHLVKVAALIDTAERSIDVAMYSFNDARIMDALKRAVQRGVSIRMIYDPASTERTNPAGSRSAKLEENGVDVRYINKVMHHKFVIVDGPRDAASQAQGARMATGSGNWSNSAGTRYDENTVFLEGHEEAALRFQREFNHLWKNSRDFVSNPALTFFESTEITDAMIAAVDDPDFDVFFTSANFRTFVSSSNGPTFSVVAGRNEVANQMVALIQNATTSIRLASGHLRSRPIFEALVAKHQANPGMDIRIYLDGQEYISQSADRDQQRELEQCLMAAGANESARQACMDRGFLFAYEATEAGIPTRLKYYAFRWDHSYAEQMHHKYMIVDGNILASGSYNLSDNAEHATMENMVVYRGATFAALIDQFEANFEQMWVTGEAEGRYDELLEQVENGTGPFPIVFPAMAITVPEIATLKREMAEACPDINSTDFRNNPSAHRVCYR